MGEYLSGVFEKFSEWNGYILAAVVLLVLFAVGMYFAGRKVKWNTRMLASAAMCVALTYVLGQIRLFTMPQGGSITPGSMLPVMLFSMAYGVWPGFLAGALCGMLGLLQSAYVIHPIQMILDYLLAMAMVGLGAIVRNKRSLGAFRLPLAGVQGQYRLRKQTQHRQTRQQGRRNALGELLHGESSFLLVIYKKLHPDFIR